MKSNVYVSANKYEITDIAHPKYPWLHRIRALTQVNEQVEPGSLGGFVESKHNLSDGGSCWIYDNAICCENAFVNQYASLFDGAIAREHALISGTGCLYDSAIAEGSCCVSGGEVKEHARIAGKARVSSIDPDGLLSPLICGDSQVYGEVQGCFEVKDLILPGEKLINPTEDLFVLENKTKSVLRKPREWEPSSGDGRIKKKKREIER